MNILNIFKPKVIIKEVEKKIYLKAFNASKIDRLNEDFRATLNRINDEIRTSLANLRGRSRTLSQNNDYYIRALNLFTNYVIGPQGFTLVNRIKDENGISDKEADKKIKTAWNLFGNKKYFTVNKKESFYSFQKNAAFTFARDGEVFVRVIRGYDNKFGVTFQIIEADFLDETYCSNLANGNYIRQGIEINSMGEVVKYHFTDPKDMQRTDYGYVSKGGIKVEYNADEIIHIFNRVETNQMRGYPPFQNLMLALFGLSELNDSEMVAFRAGSCKMGFIEEEFPDEALSSGFGGNPTDGEGNSIDEIQAGLIVKLRKGEKFTAYNPDHKSGNWETFSRGILRSAASGSGFPYCLLSNDYTGMDADSVRLQINDARDFGLMMQKIFIDDLINPMYEEWLTMSLMKQAINLPIRKLEKLSEHEFRGRAFQALRPLEDMQAMEIAINNALDSRTSYNMSLNRDVEDVFEELGHEEEMAKEYDFPLRNQGGTTEHNINSGASK